MIDMKAWESGRGTQQTQPTTQPAAPTPPATTQASGIPEQYQGWNPGAQYQITPAQWAQWGGGDDWQSGWYRKPSDPGHVVYNEQYGYQDWPTAYGGGALTPNWDIAGFAADPDRNKANIPGYPQYEAQNQGGQGQASPWGGWQDLFSQFFGGQGYGQQAPQGIPQDVSQGLPQGAPQGGPEMGLNVGMPGGGMDPQGGGNNSGGWGGLGQPPPGWIGGSPIGGGQLESSGGAQGAYGTPDIASFDPGQSNIPSWMQNPTANISLQSTQQPSAGGSGQGSQSGGEWYNGQWQPGPQAGGGMDPQAGVGGGGQGGGGRTGGLGTYDWRGPLDTAGNTLGQFAGGIPYNKPWEWGQASQTASQFAEDGSPVGYQPWWEAQQPVLNRTISDQAKQASEQAGLAGSRWGSPLQRNITDIAGRETANTFGNFMGMSLQGQEMAKQRQQQAVNQLQSLGQGSVGLENMMRQQQMQAAGMLPGLSQTGYGIQSNIANALMQGGMGQQGMNQQALGNLLNIWGQQNPSLAMLLQAGIGGMGTPTNWAQQQYSPSGFSQFFDNLIPF